MASLEGRAGAAPHCDDAVVAGRFGAAAAGAPAPADERLLEFLDQAPVALIRFGPDGKIDLANAAAARLMVQLPGGADMADLYALLADLVPDLARRIAAFRPPFGLVCDQMRLQASDQAAILALTIRKIDPDTFMAVVQGVTRVVALKASTRRARQTLHVMFENLEHHAVFRVGLDGRIAGWNMSLRRTGGWEEEDVALAPLRIMLPPDQVRSTQISALLNRARQLGTATLECWHVCKNGSRFWGSTLVTKTPDEDGNTDGFVLLTRDLTERLHMTEMHQLATTDALTGALNRRAGVHRLESGFDVWRRVHRTFSILMVDLDNFKSVNDTWGHGCGDRVLVATVQVMRDRLRERDCVIRWGGEEFLLLLPETPMVGALLIAERVRAAVAAQVVLAGEGPVNVTVSVGVAQVSGDHGNLNELVACADRALYVAKESGRNRVIAAG